jgi:ankyrin repeat protein
MEDIFELIDLNLFSKVKELVAINQEFLLERDINGNTIFIYSVFHKKWDVADFLLFQKLNDIDAVNDKQETALMYAARYGNLEFVQKLHKNGADLNKSSLYVGPVVFYAFEHLKKDVLIYLVINGADVNVKNKYGSSLLVKSVENNEISLINWLVNNGAEDIDSALRAAVLFDSLDSVKELVDLGANINLLNKNNESLIVEAINNKNWDIVEYLFNSGANIISNTTTYGWDILSSAAQEGKLTLVKNIIELTNTNI